MAKSATKTPNGRRVVAGTKPAHLGARGGVGRSRQATDFDDLVPEWFQACKEDPNLYLKIEAEGDSDEAKLEDLEQVFKDVSKAAAYHNLGIDRLREDDPNKEGFESYGIHVRVRERQARGPKPGSLRDPETNKLVSPDDESGRYAELLELKNNNEL